MSDHAAWLEANDRFLASELAKLRDRLEKLAGVAAPAIESEPKPAEKTADTTRLGRLFGSTARTTRATSGSSSRQVEPDALPPPAAAAQVPTAEHRPALDVLTERLGLSPFERDVLLLCLAMELDTRLPTLCARAQADVARPYPTFALAMALFETRTWDALSPERPLRYWRLLEINQPGAQPLIAAALRADERIVNYLKGLNYLDDRLAPLISPLNAVAIVLPPSQRAVAGEIVKALRSASRSDRLPAIQLLGSDVASKGVVAQAVCAELDVHLYRLSAELIPAPLSDQETLIRLWQRESQLLPLALLVDASELQREEAHAGATRRFIERLGGLVFVDTRESLGDASQAISFDVARPTPAEQRKAWTEALGERAAELPARMAGQFDFNTGRIREVAAAALSENATPDATAASLWTNALARSRPSLDHLAQRIETNARWDDLRLPLAEKQILQQIADQVALRSVVYDDWGFRERTQRGLAVTALFAGESGTGKTMAAEVLAHELGLLLYRIDLSAVVSKYIGETEKNLRRLFDAAEQGGAILFFDEADALFGRRSEVKDSHDRYANIEVNYLLQRLESFRGLAILATNVRAALDQAFVRRLRFIVNFPFPGIVDRKAIWQAAFPPAVKMGPLDFDRLARLTLSGANIQTIAMNACFAAAATTGEVTMSLVLESAKAEFRKLDRPINEADFRPLQTLERKA